MKLNGCNTEIKNFRTIEEESKYYWIMKKIC